jgi:membrane protein YdbS with pleckstrin-like domain
MMNLFWIGLGIISVFQISTGICAYYVYDPKVVTSVGNCAIPVLAALIVVFINHMKRQLALMAEDEE